MYTEKKEPRTVIDRVQPTDVVDFFLNYIVNDQLGRIADGHLALADASPQLANDDRCMQLVDLHTVAVDFAKTGVPVDPAKVGRLLRGVQFPDYMNGLRRYSTNCLITAACRDKSTVLLLFICVWYLSGFCMWASR